MEFRSYADLSRLVHDSLCRIPPDVDLIAAVPRSGVIPACMLALALNLPTTDVDGLVLRRPISTGQTRRFRRFSGSVTDYRHVLIIDDTVHTGHNFALVRQKLGPADLTCKITFAAVYASPEAAHCVDLHFETCPFPRIFEWNFLHQSMLTAACIDIDGVLCLDPTGEENDDGPRYREFLRSAVPHFRPQNRVYHLVTSRLEHYRPETEDWLHRHNIQFERLSMLDLPNAEARRRLRAHAPFKGSIYRDDPRAEVFVESEVHQAPLIAAVAGKPVICVGNQKFYRPPPGGLLTGDFTVPRSPSRTWWSRVQRRISRWSDPRSGRDATC
jgi:uncharacterized HAD superfamily protein/orotate phosphoribosyltransferase